MPNIAIITDTDSSLPKELAAAEGILQVPITVHFENESFTTGVDIDDRLLFEKVDRLKKLPTTSAPAPSAFQAAYEKAFKNGAEAIVCICVSSVISSTYSAALSACEAFPGKNIRVIDSLTVSMAQGFMALAAAEAAREGASLEEVVTRVEETAKRQHVFAVLPTLKYLAMSGRVGKFMAGMADTLNIKPILTVKDGKLVLVERIRTRSKAVERILELVKGEVAGRKIQKVALVHVANPDGARELEELLRRAMPCPPEIITAEFTAGLAVHTGLGVVGVIVQTGE